MTGKLISQVIIIAFGLVVGMYFSKMSYEEHEKLGHSEIQAHKGMDHGILDISREKSIPKIEEFEISKDPMSGWNGYIQVSNFRFAPEHASQPHREGEGHVHLYINGSKIARIYGNWFHIPELVKDKNEIKITLNSNDHQTFAIGKNVIEKIITKEKDL